ncbi:HAD-IB family phosphatase [Roseburia faecis]|jgi:phosphatidylglycerophosphatase C|uniref:HAD-IB family phosphatase n=1 Tax=Roseburia faecis TaxID=301302 RepID=UPI0031B5D7C7
MNVYDFDKTIYDGDSTIDFYFYCLKKHPKIILCLPIQLYAAVKYKLKVIDKTNFKEKFYCFLKKIPDIDMELNCFWDKNGYRIKEWYKNQKRENDVIISASPEFLLNGICKRIGVNNLIASQVDKRTGKYIGVNCYGKEKTRRFYQKYQYEIIDEFYSDSYSDEPMAKLAKKSFIVSKDIIKKW